MGNFNNAVHLSNVVNAALVGGANHFGSSQAHQRFVEEIGDVTRKHLDDAGLVIPSQGSTGHANSAAMLDTMAQRMEQEAIFVDLLSAAQVVLNGYPAVRTVCRIDLLAQELINNAVPSEIVVDQDLLAKFPVIAISIWAMAGKNSDWKGRLLSDLASDYARAHEPSTTEIVRLAGRGPVIASFTLADLWDAVRAANGSWMVKGHHLSFTSRLGTGTN